MLCKSTVVEDPATKLHHPEALWVVERLTQTIPVDVGVCDTEEARGVYDWAVGPVWTETISCQGSSTRRMLSSKHTVGEIHSKRGIG